ncbi:hypothetical protein RGCCGE502_22820 [Rhizobium grahamii CCGE 502]|uniref:Uncharacterized protein n=1 Tax=Rhizobium grahamii CCGE 502 TaxID=990285 RepID=S3HA69_9HYPH|nr:hypothetical protein RGCCGE502_22820 [Rhizobium grahamii CCGE 502]
MLMERDADLTQIADQIINILPQGDEDAAQVALAVAAAKCIDAGLTDDQASAGLVSALRSIRKRLLRGRSN